MAARIPMIATTIINSIRVKPRWMLIMVVLLANVTISKQWPYQRDMQVRPPKKDKPPPKRGSVLSPCLS